MTMLLVVHGNDSQVLVEASIDTFGGGPLGVVGSGRDVTRMLTMLLPLRSQ